MKELQSMQLNSLALQITVAISKTSIGDGWFLTWVNTQAVLGIVRKSISRLAPKPCQGPV